MEGFVKVNKCPYEVSKVVPCSVSLVLTLTWSIYILLKLTPEIGTEFEKRPLHTIPL